MVADQSKGSIRDKVGWELREVPETSEIWVIFRGYLSSEDGAASSSAFSQVLQRGQYSIIWDVHEMTGYDTIAMAKWAAKLRPLRKNIVRLRLVGGNSIIRAGARVLASVAGVVLSTEGAEEAIVVTQGKSTAPSTTDASSDFVVLSETDELIVLAKGAFVVVDTPKLPSVQSIERLRELLKTRSAQEKRLLGVVNVMSPRIGVTVGSEHRKAALQLGEQMNSIVAAHALLLLGEGVFVAWARSVVMGLSLTLRGAFPTTITGEVREAAKFVTAKMNLPGEETTLRALIEMVLLRSNAM